MIYVLIFVLGLGGLVYVRRRRRRMQREKALAMQEAMNSHEAA